MRLVVFDCDGTLVDSQNMIATAMQLAFERAGFSWPGREATLSIVGLSLVEAMRVLVPDATETDLLHLAESYKSSFRELRANPALREPLFEGAAEALDRLSSRDDVLLGIATGKSRRGVDVLLERENWQGRFHTIQTADTARSKPDPDMLFQAMAETGATAASTVMIGDTTFDMQMARQAQVTAIGVDWGYHPASHLGAAGAHHIVSHFSELEQQLEALPEM